MRKIVFLYIFLSICSCFLVKNEVKISLLSENVTESIDENLNNIDFTEIDNYIENLSDSDKTAFSGSFIQNIKKILNGEVPLNIETAFNLIFSSFFSSFNTFLPHFIIILAISVLSGILSSSQSAQLIRGTSGVVFYVAVISVSLVVATDIGTLINNSKIAINNLTNLINILLPIIVTIMIANGKTVSASIYQPTVAFLSGGVSDIFIKVLFPLITMSVVFSILNHLSKSFKLNKMQDFLGGVIKWIVGIFLAVFSFYLTTSGISSANIDGFSLRAVKYTISNSVPIVGGFVKEGFDILLASSSIIKNAIGIGGILIGFSILLSPFFALLAYSLLLKLFAAIIEPVSEGGISGILSGVSKSVSYLIAITVSVAVMVFISLLLLILSANVFI